MKVTREHGRIMSVETKFRGDALAEDALAGATTLVVGDAGDFDEDGGWLTINGQVVEFTECDDDEGTITLAEGLAAAAEQGDAVHLWSEFYQEPVDYQEILVELDGEYDNPESVVAELADGLPELPEGDRGRAGESCVLLRVSDDEWEVVNVGGRPRKATGVQFHQDVFTLTTAGAQTLALTNEPIAGSEHVYWNGFYQRQGSAWSRSGEAGVSLLGGQAKVGDVIVVEYAYRNTVPTRQPATFKGVTSGAAPENSGTLTVPLPTHADGDLLLLFVGRSADIPTPAGWELQDAHQSSFQLDTGDPSTLYLFTRTADGAETEVTLTTATLEVSSVNLAAVALAYDGDFHGSTSSVLDPATSADLFPAPTVPGPTQLSAAVYDGEGTKATATETITTAGMSGPTRANLSLNSGQWSLAVAEGAGNYADSAGDTETHLWLGVGVGLAAKGQ